MEKSILRAFITLLRRLAVPISLAAGLCASFAADCVPAPAGLVSWWRGEETFADEAGSNAGSRIGDVGFAPAIVGKGFTFDGKGSYVKVPDSASLNFTNELSLELWYKDTGSPAEDYGLISKRAPYPGGCNFGINVMASNGLQVYFRDPSYSGDYPAAKHLPVPTPGVFHHVVGTFRQTNHIVDAKAYPMVEVKAYLDGALVQTAWMPGSLLANTLSSEPVVIGADNEREGYFVGIIDEVAIYSRALQPTEVEAIYRAEGSGKCPTPSCVAGPSGLVGWWRGELDANDTAGSHDGVLVNGAHFEPGEVGGSFAFNGINQYVRVPDAPLLNPTNAITLEAWVYVEAYPNIDGVAIVAKGTPTLQYQLALQSAQGRWFFRPWVTVPAGIRYFAGTTTVELDTWYHLALTYDGSILKQYVNGELDGSMAVSGPIVPKPQDLTIGGEGSGWFFNGRVDELGLYHRALTQAELQAIYAAGNAGKCPTPPAPVCVAAPSGLVSWWRGEGTGIDQAGTNNGFWDGTPLYASGIVGQAFEFNGSGNHLRVPASPSLDVGKGQAFTVEGWIKISDATTEGTIVEWTDGRRGFFGVLLNVNVEFPGELIADVQGSDGAPRYIRTAPGALAVGPFQHVALTYDKASGTAKLFVNGALGKEEHFGAFTPVTTSDLYIGYRPEFVPFGPISFKGMVDEISVYSRALSNEEIQKIYKAGSAGKCLTPPPPDCNFAPSGLVGWWRGEGNGNDQAGTNNATWNGTPFYGSGMVGQAFEFNGSGNHLRVPPSPSLDVGKGESFTVEGWIKTPSSTVGGPIVEWTDGRRGAYGVHFYANLAYPGELFANIYGSDGESRYIRTEPGALSPGVFQHVALTYQKSSGIAKLFVNGTVGIEKDFGSFTPVTTSNVYIGFRPEYVPFGPTPFTGVIDEISVYNRALSNEEIEKIYAANAAGKCTGETPPGCTNLPSGIVGWFKAENDVVDATGKLAPGVFSNAVFSAGKVGQAFSFNGSNSVLEVPDSPFLRLTNQLSIEFWVKRLRIQENTGEFIVEKGGDWTGGVQNFGVSLHAPWAEGVLHFLSAGGWWGAGSILDNEWHHCAIVARHGESAPTFYIDGVVRPVRFHEGAPTINLYNSSRPMHIGAQIDPVSGWTYYGNTLIDELTLYNRMLTAAEVQAIHLAGSAGKCSGTPPPPQPVVILQHPTSRQAQVGTTVEFSVVASGTSPIRYQWQFNGTNILGATNAVLRLPNVQLSAAGPYRVMVENAVNSVLSQEAILMVTRPPAVVRIVPVTATSAGTKLSVPVEIVANGNENALGFSVSYDRMRLTLLEVQIGESVKDGSLLVNYSQTNASFARVGVALALPVGASMNASTQKIANLIFRSAVSPSQVSTGLGFEDSPTKRELVSAQAVILPVQFVGAMIKIPAMEVEGDVSPRPNGDQKVTIADWVQAGRFAAKLDTLEPGPEFERADCSPRTGSDGVVGLGDWVQTGRYATGLDPLTAVGAPVFFTMAGPLPEGLESESQLRLGSSTLVRGQPNRIPVTLEAAGNENAVGFSVSFDASKLTYTGASLGAGAKGALLNVNDTESANGRLAFMIALQPGSAFAQGSVELLDITMQSVGVDSGSYPVSFGDTPIFREVIDVNAEPVSAKFMNGAVSVLPAPTLRVVPRAGSISLAWPNWATNFVLQESEPSLSTWTNTTGVVTETGGERVITVPAHGSTKFFRLRQP